MTPKEQIRDIWHEIQDHAGGKVPERLRVKLEEVLTTPNTVEEIAQSLMKKTTQFGGLKIGDIEQALTLTRQQAFDEAVERLERKKKEYETATPMNPDYDEAYNQALTQAQNIISDKK